jgi:PAS domain S-box-containing protein
MVSTLKIAVGQRPLGSTDDASRPNGWLILSVIVAAAGVLAFDVWTSPGRAAAVAYVTVVLLSLNARNARFLLIVASTCTCLTLIGFCLPSAPERSEIATATANRLLAILAIWVTAVVGFRHCRSNERRSREERNAALLAALAGSTDEAIISLDLEGIVSSWNHGAGVMYGYTEAEMIGCPIARLWPPQAHRAAQMVLRRAAQGETSRNQEVVWLAKNGRTVDVALTVSPVWDASGAIVSICTVGRDISDSKRHEESLELWAAELRETTRESLQRKQEAEEANRAKSQFLANMSHELRTPLNAIIGYGEMLHEDAVHLDQKEMARDLEKICGAGRHLFKLINDVLDLSKVEAGKMDVYVEQFEIRPFLDEVASTVKPLVEEKRNTLTVRCDPQIGWMRSDRTKVRQCLFNLLSNSAKFTDCGTISLVVSQFVEDRRAWISFQVSDTGIGISQDQLQKVFEAFVQAENSTTRKYGGTGLGLTISKRFCELLGGQLQAESELGKGSTFTVHVPAGIEAAVVGTILAVDDDPDAAKFLADEIRDTGAP